jgi:hypothetical protein
LSANVFKVVNEIFSVSDDVVMKGTLPFEFRKWGVEIVFGDKSSAVFGDPGDICGVVKHGSSHHFISGGVIGYPIGGEVT